MKKQRKQSAEESIVLRLWTYAGAVKAVPYFRSMVQSLREAWLELRQAQTQVRRLEARPGRPDRNSLILLDDSKRDVARLEGNLERIIDEMVGVSAYCIDPAAGLAVVPFLRGDALAWFVFDLFDSKGLNAWRLHTDPLEMRRLLAELDEPHSADGVTERPLARKPADERRAN